MRIAGEAHGVEERRLAGADVVRGMAAPGRKDVTAEVGQSPANGDPEPGGRRLVAPLQRLECSLELALRAAQVTGPDLRGHELVVAGRDQNVDAVVLDDLDAVEDVLLGRRRRAGRALRRRPAQVVDELVDPGSPERRGRSAGECVPACQLHARTSTRPRRIRFRT